MTTNLTVLKETADALNDVVSAFAFFRNENPGLNQLLQDNVENILHDANTSRSSSLNVSLNDTIETISEEYLSDEPRPRSRQTPVVDAGNSRKRKIDAVLTDKRKWKRFKRNVDSYLDLESSENEDDDEDTSPEGKVFAIDSVLESILRRLSTEDVISCRLVSSRWNSIASELLLETQIFIFHFNDKSSKFQLGFGIGPRDAKNNLSDLTSLLEVTGGKNFPCNAFSFSGGPLNHEDLQAFLKIFGPKIKILRVEVESHRSKSIQYPPNINDLKKLLSHQAPNIENLTLYNFPIVWSKKLYLCQLFPEPISVSNDKLLSKLKFLYFPTGAPAPILEAILDVAAKLEEISWSKTSDNKIFIQNLLKYGKISLLKELTLQMSDLELNCGMYGQFANCFKPFHSLQSLQNEHRHRSQEEIVRLPLVSNIISKLLKCSADSLKFLKMCPLGFLPCLRIPAMTKLETLQFSTNSDFPDLSNKGNDGTFFPNGLRLAEAFPALKCIVSDLEFKESYDCYPWETYFNINVSSLAKINTVSSLIKIDFSEGPPLSWITNFAVIFPNLSMLKMGSVTDIVEAMVIFSQFSHLTNLEFGIDLKNEGNKYPSADAAFTGFSKDTCIQLYRTSRGADLATLTGLRTKRSLLNLKNLRHLKLSIEDLSDEVEDGEDAYCQPVLSHVSGLYSFQMCPQLQVEIVVHDSAGDELWTAVSPIFPYVQSYHEAA